MSSIIIVFFAVFLFLGTGIAIYLLANNEHDRRIKEVVAKQISADDIFVSSWDRSFVALNYTTKKLLIGRDEQWKQFNFEQIIQVDLVRDDNAITSTNRGSQLAGAAVGGVVLGPLGFLAGALSGKTLSQNLIRRLALRIITDDGAYSVIFIDAGGSHQGFDPSRLQFMIDQADAAYGWILRALQISQRSATAQAQASQITVSAPPTNIDLIKKLWELKECGAISSVEYEMEKGKLTGTSVFEQSKATWEKIAVESMRPGEGTFGNLITEEENWLVNAFAQLNRICEKRSAGEDAFCIFDAGGVYVQFLALCDTDQLVCEAVSARNFPRIASVLRAGGSDVLLKLGFNEPNISDNYSQTINIKCNDDLRYATRLGFRVLKEAYQVTDFEAVKFAFE